MKRILFDLLGSQPVEGMKFYGGGEYMKTVFNRLVKNHGDECDITVFFSEKLFLDQWIYDLIGDYEIRVIHIDRHMNIKDILEEEEFDVFFSGWPYKYRRNMFPGRVKTIGTIHGLREIEMPIDDYTYLYKNTRKEKVQTYLKKYAFNKMRQNQIHRYGDCLDALDEIVCVSKHSKYSLINVFPDQVDKNIEVFYTPMKYVKEDMAQVEEIVPEHDDFILILGGDRWIKNAYRAIMAIDEMKQRNLLRDYHVVVVGKPNHEIQASVHNRDEFTFYDYVEPAYLEALYKHCHFFLYPTLNEGFGMPPLEAMKYGKTCIVGAVSSVPEICGDAVYYVNPFDSLEIKNRIIMASEHLIDPEKIRTHLEKINKKQEEDLDRICKKIVKG